MILHIRTSLRKRNKIYNVKMMKHFVNIQKQMNKDFIKNNKIDTNEWYNKWFDKTMKSGFNVSHVTTGKKLWKVKWIHSPTFQQNTESGGNCHNMQMLTIGHNMGPEKLKRCFPKPSRWSFSSHKTNRQPHQKGVNASIIDADASTFYLKEASKKINFKKFLKQHVWRCFWFVYWWCRN